MSDDLHTSWTDGVTEYSAADMNAPLLALDLAIQALGQITVADKDLTAPPGSEADGDTYIVAAGATGAWTGHDGEIAYYDADTTAYRFYDPVEGVKAYVQDENIEYYYTGSAWAKYYPYIVAGFFPGTPGNSELCLKHTFPIAADFPSGLTGSQSKAGTAADAETVFSIKKNAVEVGTITYAAAGTTGTYAMASATSFAVGDILTIVGPASADAAIADIDFALKGVR